LNGKPEAASGCLVIGQICGRRLNLWPIGCTPALWRKAPLQLQFAACGAIATATKHI